MVRLVDGDWWRRSRPPSGGGGWRRHAGRWPGRRAVRIGVAAGDVAWDEDDSCGSPVVTATSLQAAADGGQILVNEVVRLLAGDQRGDHFEPIGPLQLGALPGSTRAYAVGVGPRRPSTRIGSPRRPPLPLALAAATAHAFVGRDDALAVLEASWQLARSAGQVVLVGGEAGPARPAWPPSSPDWCTPTVPPCSSAAVTTTWPCRTNRGCRRRPAVRAHPGSRRRRPGRHLFAPLGPLIAHGEWLEPVGPPPDPESARYRLYEAVRDQPSRPRGAWPTVCARRPALGRRADARPAAPPRQVRAAGELARRRARSATPATRSPSRLPRCLADLRRIGRSTACASRGSTATPSSAS